MASTVANQMKGTIVNFTGILFFIKVLGLIVVVRCINPTVSCISFRKCNQIFQK